MTDFPKVQQVSNKYLEKIICDADARTIDLIEGLDEEQLMGPKLSIVNPTLWSIGHIAWFYEKFILRDRENRAPVLECGDTLYDSTAVAQKTRWDLNLPDLETTIKYRETIRDLILERLGSDKRASAENSYFMQLTAFHEDMHGEGLTSVSYTHLTLPTILRV